LRITFTDEGIKNLNSQSTCNKSQIIFRFLGWSLMVFGDVCSAPEKTIENAVKRSKIAVTARNMNRSTPSQASRNVSRCVQKTPQGEARRSAFRMTFSEQVDAAL